MDLIVGQMSKILTIERLFPREKNLLFRVGVIIDLKYEQVDREDGVARLRSWTRPFQQWPRTECQCRSIYLANNSMVGESFYFRDQIEEVVGKI